MPADNVMGFSGGLDGLQRRLAGIEITPDPSPADVMLMICEALRDERGEIIDWILRHANGQLLQETGLAWQDLAGKRVTEILGTSPQIQSLIDLAREAMVTGCRRSKEVYSPQSGRSFLFRLQPLDGHILATEVIDVTERKQEVNLNQALDEINGLIHSTLEFDTIMNRVVAAAAQAIDCQASAISLRAADHWTVAYCYGFPREVIGSIINDWEEPHAMLAVKTKKPVVVNDVLNDERVNPEHMRKWKIRSVMAVPLFAGDQVIGVLFFNYREHMFLFHQAHIDFACKLASSISLAITNAKLYRKIQEELAERKRTEEHLREKKEELTATYDEMQVQQKELTHVHLELKAQTAQLNAAYQELREAYRHKNEFLAILSHELRNPLTSISSSLHILDRVSPGGEQAKRANDIINRQTEQLTHLVDDLLDITRVTQNKIKLHRERLELNELIRLAVEDHWSYFEKNGVQLEAEYAQDEVFVYADGARLAQVIGNLLQNAAKFTRQGGSAIISVASDLQEQSAIISVADTGVGMSPDLLPLLFQPFMQADTTLDRSHGGLGLGLALSKGLIELHAGRMSAHSDGEGKGSEFVILLPLDETPVEALPNPQKQSPGSHRRVLIIDDNADLAESLRDLLELDGHRVAVANDGPQGLAMARQHLPEVVLCDIGLPGMDGYAVARAFRADADLQGVYLVALSGYAQPEDLERSAEAGFDRHLAKPPAWGVLERTLEQAPYVVARS